MQESALFVVRRDFGRRIAVRRLIARPVREERENRDEREGDGANRPMLAARHAMHDAPNMPGLESAQLLAIP